MASDLQSAVNGIAKGIKCDNESCNYSDMSVDFDPDKFLEMPCPECGESLFTKADYDTFMILITAADLTNGLLVGIDLAEGKDEAVVMTASFDGSGMPKLDVATVEDYYKKYTDYIDNAGGSVTEDQFDDDWEPIGKLVRDDMLDANLIAIEQGVIRINNRRN